MQTVNRRATLDYWQMKLSQENAFADVAWDCWYEPDCDCRYRYGDGSATVAWDCPYDRRHPCDHHHEDGHALVLELVEKAEGNFLWTTLVANTLSQLLKGGTSLVQLRQYVDKTPGNLTDYLRESMIMRVSPAWDAQKSMALKMSIYTLSWIPFWMLRNGNLQQLSQAEPNIPIVLIEYTLQEIRGMMHETIQFLQECCRDILNLRSLTNCAEMNDHEFATEWYEAKASFTHRSVFDFLRTPDAKTQQLVFNDLPSFFDKEHFKACLQILQWSIRPAKEAALWSDHGHRLGCCFSLAFHTIADRNAQNIASWDLAVKAEKVCLHQGDIIPVYGKRIAGSPYLDYHAIELCYALAGYDLYTLTDMLLENVPWILCLPYFDNSMVDRVIRSRQPDPLFTRFKLLEKIVDAGADPNEHIEITCSDGTDGWSTPWCFFLEFLDGLATNVPTSNHENVSSISNNPNTTQGSIVSITPHATFFSPHIQRILRRFLQAGADLELEAVEPNQDCPGRCGYCFVHRSHPRSPDARIEPLPI